MAETQGRGPEWDDFRVEKAAKYAHENGGTAASIEHAAKREFGTSATSLIEAIRAKIRKLFG